MTHEKRVLLIDLDPQANASIGLNVLIAPTAFGTKLLLQDDRYTIAECVYEKSPFLDVIPSHRTLADTQHTLLLDPEGALACAPSSRQAGSRMMSSSSIALPKSDC